MRKIDVLKQIDDLVRQRRALLAACEFAFRRLDDVDGRHPDTLKVMDVLEQAIKNAQK